MNNLRWAQTACKHVTPALRVQMCQIWSIKISVLLMVSRIIQGLPTFFKWTFNFAAFSLAIKCLYIMYKRCCLHIKTLFKKKKKNKKSEAFIMGNSWLAGNGHLSVTVDLNDTTEVTALLSQSHSPWNCLTSGLLSKRPSENQFYSGRF